MWLIRASGQDGFELAEYLNEKPPYAILSHTWGPPAEEVTFEDFPTERAIAKAGFEKLLLCQDQARQENLEYFWIDSACIKKSSTTEVQEAINSMFRWYQEAAVCYAYMSDVSVANTNDASPAIDNSTFWPPSVERQFCQSRYFTRGWTLQELLAPSKVKFFSAEGVYLGDKSSLESLIHRATGIHIQALRGCPLDSFSVQTRLSWAVNRRTTRQEDAAYSLTSLFHVYMSHQYGEGREEAMHRLQRKIEKRNHQRRPWQSPLSAVTAVFAISIVLMSVIAFTRLPFLPAVVDSK